MLEMRQKYSCIGTNLFYCTIVAKYVTLTLNVGGKAAFWIGAGEMEGQEYFKQALSDFAFDAACGGEIRHLADLGYTVKQIAEQLSCPVPYGRVQQAVWKHLSDTGALLLEEPGIGTQKKAPVFVKEYDKYGRPSFRRINGQAQSQNAICWIERCFLGKEPRELQDFLAMQCERNGENFSFVSCSFGLKGQTGLASELGERQQEYILGLPWEQKIVYHKLDQRMREIVARLYRTGKYHETLYFQKNKEKVFL